MFSTPDKSSGNHLREVALLAVQRLQSSGFTAYWAGGCVRDMLMGQSPRDYDIATTATPSEVIRLFPGSLTVGKSFGVVQARMSDVLLEVATFRKDLAYKDGRRPEAISYADPITDARRRDFTINAMFYDPVSENLYDYAAGRDDLQSRVIRCVGEPEMRITEDYLRMLRAVRFASTLEFSLEQQTAAVIRKRASLISRVSPDRIRQELTRTLLEARHAGDALVLLDHLRLLEIVLPEINAMKGQAQPPEFHAEGDVFRHTFLMLNMMHDATLILAWALLLHDVGKPVTAKVVGGRIRFNGHASEGAELATSILRRLRFPVDAIRDITYCIRNHMRFMDVPNMKRSTLRKLVGAPTFTTELELHRLDCLASHGDLTNYHLLVNFQRDLQAEPVLPKPWVNGNDIIAIGLPEGPQIGAWWNRAYDAQLEGRFDSKEELLKWLRNQIESSRDNSC